MRYDELWVNNYTNNRKLILNQTRFTRLLHLLFRSDILTQIHWWLVKIRPFLKFNLKFLWTESAQQRIVVSINRKPKLVLLILPHLTFLYRMWRHSFTTLFTTFDVPCMFDNTPWPGFLLRSIFYVGPQPQSWNFSGIKYAKRIGILRASNPTEFVWTKTSSLHLRCYYQHCDHNYHSC